MAESRRHSEARRGTFLVEGHLHRAAPLGPGLHVVATPIGHLGDMTLRALATLAAADVVACEDTRVTSKLLAHYGINASLIAYHEHNAERVRPVLLAKLEEGQAVALVSDAGTPLVSDPGYRLVLAAREAGYPVAPVPGPSAVLAAMAVAGLPTDRFLFAGFLPPKTVARRARLAELASVPATLVLFETGPRLAAALADAADVLGPRDAAICRELTKLHEEVRRAPLGDLAAAYRESAAPKGEIVLVIGPPVPEARPTVESLDERLREAIVRRGSVKAAAEELAAATGLGRRDLYQRALVLAETTDHE